MSFLAGLSHMIRYKERLVWVCIVGGSDRIFDFVQTNVQLWQPSGGAAHAANVLNDAVGELRLSEMCPTGDFCLRPNSTIPAKPSSWLAY
jgi:hypothetical protein